MKIGKTKSGMMDHTDLLVALKIMEVDKLKKQKEIINQNKQKQIKPNKKIGFLKRIINNIIYPDFDW